MISVINGPDLLSPKGFVLNSPFWTLGKSIGHLHRACVPLYVCRGAAIIHVSEVCTPVKSSGATPEFSVFKLN